MAEWCTCGHSLNQHERNCPGDGGAPCEECECSGFDSGPLSVDDAEAGMSDHRYREGCRRNDAP